MSSGFYIRSAFASEKISWWNIEEKNVPKYVPFFMTLCTSYELTSFQFWTRVNSFSKYFVSFTSPFSSTFLCISRILSFWLPTLGSLPSSELDSISFFETSFSVCQPLPCSLSLEHLLSWSLFLPPSFWLSLSLSVRQPRALEAEVGELFWDESIHRSCEFLFHNVFEVFWPLALICLWYTF